MLPKSQKIPREIFDEILSGKNGATSPFFSTRFFKTKKTLPSRFSFVVSKKIAKNAVERNTLKRRGYSFLQKNKIRIKPSFVVVFFLKKGSEKLSTARFCEEIVSSLLKIKAWE